MTNKDYKRLTFQHNRHGGMICGVGMKANYEEEIKNNLRELGYTLRELEIGTTMISWEETK